MCIYPTINLKLFQVSCDGQQSPSEGLQPTAPSVGVLVNNETTLPSLVNGAETYPMIYQWVRSAASEAVTTGLREAVALFCEETVQQQGTAGRSRRCTHCDKAHNLQSSCPQATDPDGYDGDLEDFEKDMELEMRSVRKRGVKQGRRTTNILNDQFREYLRMKGVLPTHGACLSDCIDIAVVEAYAAGMGDGPDIAAPRLDWMADFKSSWNRETIHILSKDFLREVRAGDHRLLEYNPVEMKLEKMVASCRSKLQ
ncbi:hypothetical protein AcW2_005599 [Taiwanofungus camphoratus]|nr:hypothetical protein AcW2_005599 [Antrodia cinnamomea]